jgi:PucR C-terminal helix-turn-helix domain
MILSRSPVYNEPQPKSLADRLVSGHKSRVSGYYFPVSPQPPLTVLANRARARSDAIVEEIAEAFRAHVPGYHPAGGLSDSSIRKNIAAYVDDVLSLAGGGPEPSPEALETIMRQRADEGITLTSLLQAYRLGVPILWQAFADLAKSNEKHKDALIAATPALFAIMDAYSRRAHAVYREIEIRNARRNEQIRATMLDIVLGGSSSAEGAFWDAVTALGIPRAGDFAVIAAVAPQEHSTEDATPDIDALVAAHPGVEEAWFRLKPRAQLGLVSLRRNRSSNLDGLAGKIAARLAVRIGLSSPFTMVAECAKARAQAQVAARASSATRPTIRYNRDVLSVLMASSPDAATTVVSATLGPVLTLPPERRDPLINTVRTWLQRGQSVAATATEMHCHRNTVNYRLRRFAELTGRSLADNTWLAQVVLAVEAPAVFSPSD